ncbi:MAG TPA: Stp1/IreP family PP2C-type Ser/Thr phosphatase [Noviherbaspirillum sp.]|jgi:protein phosphatase|uniref:Stp1/IreP family PP2C-type Ser/Thr phosphatase n=1 Tax=Noviherbaspirillum sp. TaxID=1926288 RepID=UPI002DDD9634|nr:Stp1/IreP family PP2C-type Ser/Thr phosphatase [Noviherbaspirillum sp.]HEV2611116.1 Stp1/IreP family PP2C-type Ser/Thr phosphatase [Noviherbaspirillum sp.]
MANNVGLEFAAQTHTGMVRPHNEDAVAVSAAYNFAILADGMGGYNAGEVASGMATSLLKELLETGLQKIQQSPSDLLHSRSKQIQHLMQEAILQTNAAILDAARNDSQCQGMGTTLVAALFDRDTVTIAHIGDSRAYRLRRGELVQLTRDHSLLQEQIDAGMIAPDLARFSLNKNLITRAVGVDYELEVEMHEHQTEQGDLYLLCSDGLSDLLELDEIRNLLQETNVSLEKTCDTLIEKANYYGGRDNISVVIAHVLSSRLKPLGLWQQIQQWLTT